jgi:threonine synthase
MTLRFADTRGLDDSRPTFSAAVLAGLARGGGLYVPEQLPHFSLPELDALVDLDYAERAARIYEAFDLDFSPAEINAIMWGAYGNQWDDRRVAPVVSLDADTHMLELWHGPTSAFKDLALQCMPRFFSAALERERAAGQLKRDVLILVATSGDTGSAALAGFAHRTHTNLIVYYPAGGVSDVQRTQMTSRLGMNVGVFGVKGNFDDCQRAVKRAFADESLATWLREHASVQLSSANSINWGRLMPQIIYYLSAVVDLRAAGKLQDGDLLDVCVPTGNFGNLLAAWYAKRLGAPLGQLLCASNENCVVTDFLKSGVYDTRKRTFRLTPSPAMDILISSNLERLLYLYSEGESVQTWMRDLQETGTFQIGAPMLERLREEFAGDAVDNNDSLVAIRELWKRYHYLIEPHTAVAWRVAERWRAAGAAAGGRQRPLLVVAPAHWAKFGPNVARGLLGVAHGEPLPKPYQEMSGFELLRALRRLAPEAAHIPNRLSSLEGACERYTKTVCADDASVQASIKHWTSERL